MRKPAILGVRHESRLYHHDPRGYLVEMYRESRMGGIKAPQVNVMLSKAGVMRGSHVHRKHSDVFAIATGKGLIGMRDVRKSSPTFGSSWILELPAAGGVVVMPPGVVHGVYFPVESVLVTVESMYYDPEEELKVNWKDPDLGIPWPAAAFPPAGIPGPEVGALNPPDMYSLEDLMKKIEPWQREWAGLWPSRR